MNAAYVTLLRDFARIIKLDAAEDFIASEELIVDDLRVEFSLRRSVDGLEVWCFSPLGSIVQDAGSAIYRALLEANDYWSGTGGATVSLQAGTDNVRLCLKSTLATTSGETLALAVDRFVWAAKMMQEKLVPTSDVPMTTQPDFSQLA